MSRAGKFIPGGGGKKPRTGPIRAPEPGENPSDPSSPGPVVKKPFAKPSSLVKPVAKGQRLPIAIMSAIVCCLLVSVGWYTLGYLPTKRSLEAAQQAALDAQKRLAEEQEERKKAAEDEQRRLAAMRGTLTVDSEPSGATVTIGDFRKTTPANFADIVPGTFPMVIHADGYEDYKQSVTISADKPTDLGKIELVLQAGNLALTSPQTQVSYTLTGPDDYSHEGQIPDNLEKIPAGDYILTVALPDWKLPPIPITIHDHDNIQKEIKFPYARVNLTSVPAGATVREGHTILGQTPLNLTQIRPRTMHLAFDLPPLNFLRLDLVVPDFGNVSKQVALQQGKDFISASGIPMVWIADGNFWVGKYEVRQSEFEPLAGYNPSTFRRPTRPVETISWEGAQAFIEKLNASERKAGKLPTGYHYSLPTESQWEIYNADADINQAATSRMTSLTATQDAGASEPNKYGLYDTIGNVWEWCLDNFDDKGNHSLRGGCWLSSMEHFPNAETRAAGAPKYTDQFTGFRVVLVPN